MYEIYKIDENLYQVHSSFKGVSAREGTLYSIYKYCVHILGFDPDELEVALTEMVWNENDSCHFGVNRIFMWSFNRSEKKVA